MTACRHRLPRACAEDQAFEERVAGEAIRAVDAGPGRFARGNAGHVGIAEHGGLRLHGI